MMIRAKYSNILILIFVCMFASVCRVFAQQAADLRSVDDYGPPFSPLKFSVENYAENFIRGEHQNGCGFISGWPNGLYQIGHHFDRQQDKAGGYKLLDLAYELGLEWTVFKKLNNATIFSRIDKLRFVTKETIESLKSHGYVRNLPKEARDDQGTLQKLLEYRSYFIFPTSCGTMLFKRYNVKCRQRSSTDEFSFFNEVIVSSEGHEINTDQNNTSNYAYVFIHFYPYTYPDYSITEELVRHAEIGANQNWQTFLNTAQTMAELVPFAASARAIAQHYDTGWWEHKEIVTGADRAGLASDILLDGLPVLAQFRKFQKVSKKAFALGSSALIGATIGARIYDQGGTWDVQDVARIIVTAIISRQISRMKPTEVADDLANGLTHPSVGITSGNIAAKVNQIKQLPYFLVVVRDELAKKMRRFKMNVGPGVPRNAEIDLIVDKCDLDQILPNAVKTKVVSFFKDTQKIYDNYVLALQQDNWIAAKSALDSLQVELQKYGKKVVNDEVNTFARPASAPVGDWVPVDQFPIPSYISDKNFAQQLMKSGLLESPRGKQHAMEGSYRLDPNAAGEYEIRLPVVRFPKWKKENGVIKLFVGNGFAGNDAKDWALLQAEVSNHPVLSGKISGLDRVIPKLQTFIRGEEFLHAMSHLHTFPGSMVDVLNSAGQVVRRQISGTGFSAYSSANAPQFMDFAPAATLPSRALTIDLLSEISTMSEARLRHIAGQVGVHVGDIREFRDELLDFPELDPFIRMREAGLEEFAQALKDQYKIRRIAAYMLDNPGSY